MGVIMSEEIEFYFHRIVDQKGSFTFEADGFTVSTFGRKQYIRCAEVIDISRVFHDRTRFGAFL
jgi:hypothetical protein